MSGTQSLIAIVATVGLAVSAIVAQAVWIGRAIDAVNLRIADLRADFMSRFDAIDSRLSRIEDRIGELEREHS